MMVKQSGQMNSLLAQKSPANLLIYLFIFFVCLFGGGGGNKT